MSSAAAASRSQPKAPPVRDYVHIRVSPIAAAVGAEIGGVDLSRSLSAAVFEEIERAFVEFGVISSATSA